MRRRSRLLRAAKWAGAAASAAVLVLWIVSLRVRIMADWGLHAASIREGCVFLQTCDVRGQGKLELERVIREVNPFRFNVDRWPSELAVGHRYGFVLPEFKRELAFSNAVSKLVYYSIMLPCPLLLAATVAPTILSWRLDRRPAPGHCRRCGYNLRALTEARCPECGAGF